MEPLNSSYNNAEREMKRIESKRISTHGAGNFRDIVCPTADAHSEHEMIHDK